MDLLTDQFIYYTTWLMQSLFANVDFIYCLRRLFYAILFEACDYVKRGLQFID